MINQMCVRGGGSVSGAYLLYCLHDHEASPYHGVIVIRTRSCYPKMSELHVWFSAPAIRTEQVSYRHGPDTMIIHRNELVGFPSEQHKAQVRLRLRRARKVGGGRGRTFAEHWFSSVL